MSCSFTGFFRNTTCCTIPRATLTRNEYNGTLPADAPSASNEMMAGSDARVTSISLGPILSPS